MPSQRILIITPFSADRAALDELLRGDGHIVTTAASQQDGIAAAARCHPSVIIADAQLAERDGLRLMHRLTGVAGRPRLILLCPRANQSLERLGILCLVKPIDLGRLQDALRVPGHPRTHVA